MFIQQHLRLETGRGAFDTQVKNVQTFEVLF